MISLCAPCLVSGYLRFVLHDHILALDLRWADGFVVGDIPLGRVAGKSVPAKAVTAKATMKAPPAMKSAGGSRRRNVEKYSSSYHSIAYLSVSCLLLVAFAHASIPCGRMLTTCRLLHGRTEDQALQEWLKHIAPEVMTTIVLQACAREELMCLLFLGTGLQPTSRLPAHLGMRFSSCLKLLP